MNETTSAPSTSPTQSDEGAQTDGVRRFDAAALYAALDVQRQARGMSWQQVASEIGVSASTLTRTRLGGRMEADGMLGMVRWLGRTAESFTRVVGRKAKRECDNRPADETSQQAILEEAI